MQYSADKKRCFITLTFVGVLALLGVVIFFLWMQSRTMLSKYYGRADFEGVRAALEENMAFIEKNPNNDSAYASLGQGFYSLKGYDDAVWAYTKALAIAPANSSYWSFLAKIYQTQKNYPDARDAYIKTLELDPNKPQHYTALAWLYYFRLDTEKDKAYAVLKRGLEKFPTDKNILYDITRYYLYDENKAEFLRYAPRYLKIDPIEELISKKYQELKKK